MILFQHWIYFGNIQGLESLKGPESNRVYYTNKNSAEVFTAQYKAQLHICILVSKDWDTALIKGEILAKKKKCDAKQ